MYECVCMYVHTYVYIHTYINTKAHVYWMFIHAHVRKYSTHAQYMQHIRSSVPATYQASVDGAATPHTCTHGLSFSFLFDSLLFFFLLTQHNAALRRSNPRISAHQLTPQAGAAVTGAAHARPSPPQRPRKRG